MLNRTIKSAEINGLEERWEELVREVDTRCSETDYFATVRDGDWDAEYVWYRDSIAYFIEDIDARYNVFAAVYDYGNKELEHIKPVPTEDDTVSIRHPTVPGQPFNPWSYQSIVDAVHSQKTGVLDVTFAYVANDKKVSRPLRVYFRKVPLNNNEKYLTLLVGIPFTSDNVKLSSTLLRLIYSIYVVAGIAAGMVIYLGTRYLERYSALLSSLKNIGVK
jgi:hypothetical protein